MSTTHFTIEGHISGALGRAGVIHTPHGDMKTPAFIPVGTKATVKALTPEQLSNDVLAEAVLANTYHLHLEPGEVVVERGGGVGKFMNWKGPTFTDSGGFQIFSLGVAYGKGITKFGESVEQLEEEKEDEATEHVKLAQVDEEGVTFRSHIDGSSHRLSPEDSMRIQHKLGADIMFAFDEFTSPGAPEKRQQEVMERTHRWAKRCIDEHNTLGSAGRQMLMGIVQGGRYEHLRTESARTIGGMDFDGFGIGGTFTKKDLVGTLDLVNSILPEDKPRHLLGIGEPEDLFIGVEHGVDTFDCVTPTRIARNGMLYTTRGTINILNAKYRNDFSPIDSDIASYTSLNYTKAYLAHLFRSKEMLGPTLASIHNLYFIVGLVRDIRSAILEGNFFEFRDKFLKTYRS